VANVLREGGVDIAKSPLAQLKYLKKIGLFSEVELSLH
jgi:hypothetical protein